MNVRLATLAGLTLVACSSGSYAWRPTEGPFDEQRLRADIDACEARAREVEARGPFPASGSPRSYGEWGDQSFEACMNKRGWKLEHVRPGETSGPAAEPTRVAAQPDAAARAAAGESGPTAAASGSRASAAGPDAAAGHPMYACPVAVPGTRLGVADTEAGAAITFTTYPERIEDLRSRVHAMADRHNRALVGGGATASAPPRSRAAVEDVDGGARLVVVPSDLADLDRVRAAVRIDAQHMRDTGTCGPGEE